MDLLPQKYTERDLLQLVLSKTHIKDLWMYLPDGEGNRPDFLEKDKASAWIYRFYRDEADGGNFRHFMHPHYSSCHPDNKSCKEFYDKDIKFLKDRNYPGKLPEFRKLGGL